MDGNEDLEYVGFWARTGAMLIDSLLLLLVCIPLTWMVYGTMVHAGPFSFGEFVISYVIPAVIVIAFWLLRAATPGKMAMSPKIVDADTGEPLTPGMALVRYLGYYISLVPFGVGYLWIAFDRRKQGWHDKMVNSVVVRPKGQERVTFVRQSHGRTEPRF